ncbi:hypothetical protein KCU98_g254, partial [Aureobasidium melanogenum]
MPTLQPVLTCLGCVSQLGQIQKSTLAPSTYHNFERLTGYTRHMILGRNCRFLQSPDGNVEAGVRRKYVDDDSVLYLKNMINLRREAQISLINYRRGGQPFMNLLTMIPISWDTDQVKFFVGFQVDLVEQPNAVTDRNPDGTYSINYQRGMTMPRYVMNAPESTVNRGELGQTIPRDDVSAILSTIGTGESDFAKRMWDKVLLENTDDVIHVLSLKGLFQWISPSATKVLEYEPGEIIGTALSSICHPSDIVPVTRDLKDTSTGASVNVVFRIRRKNSGYMWFEGHGSLHTEQGKGRKSIIMKRADWIQWSRRKRALDQNVDVRHVPLRIVEHSKAEFGRVLEHARTGKKASVRHEMINRRGHVLQAFTTLYPGDATEGHKPTFIVAQTRLIKHQRVNSSSRPALSQRGSESVLSGRYTPVTPMLVGDNTPQSLIQLQSTDGAAPTYSGQNGLQLGRQDGALASEDNLFDELKTTKSSSWQYEIRQLEKKNRMLAEEVQSLLAAKKKRKRRKGAVEERAKWTTRSLQQLWSKMGQAGESIDNEFTLSPRTNSQHSVHSATSEKASKKSQSPMHPPGVHGVKTESTTPRQQSLDALAQHGQNMNATSGYVNVSSPQQHHGPTGHAAHMEGASRVPEKIEEESDGLRIWSYVSSLVLDLFSSVFSKVLLCLLGLMAWQTARKRRGAHGSPVFGVFFPEKLEFLHNCFFFSFFFLFLFYAQQQLRRKAFTNTKHGNVPLFGFIFERETPHNCTYNELVKRPHPFFFTSASQDDITKKREYNSRSAKYLLVVENVKASRSRMNYGMLAVVVVSGVFGMAKSSAATYEVVVCEVFAVGSMVWSMNSRATESLLMVVNQMSLFINLLLGSVKLVGLTSGAVVVAHLLEGLTNVNGVDGVEALLHVVGCEHVGSLGDAVKQTVLEAKHGSRADDCRLGEDVADNLLTTSLGTVEFGGRIQRDGVR